MVTISTIKLVGWVAQQSVFNILLVCEILSITTIISTSVESLITLRDATRSWVSLCGETICVKTVVKRNDSGG
jgi:hypothetical protein